MQKTAWTTPHRQTAPSYRLSKWLILASAIATVWPQLGVTAAAADDEITIVVVGDVGFSPHNRPPSPNGVYRYGFQPWSDTLSHIAGDINGDINFLNLETIVTPRNDLTRDLKSQGGPISFRTHPNGLNFLAEKHFNLLSLANNHSMDYGVEGLKETLKYVKPLRAEGVVASGIGMNKEEAGAPQLFRKEDADFAFTAMGIVANNLERHRAGENKPEQMAFRFDADFQEVLQRLRDAPAQFRILSIHYGTEIEVRADALQFAKYREEAAKRDGIDLIIGHHAHVVRGVELVENSQGRRSLIFYGLGNFVHHGTVNMAHHAICKDYGLMGRVHLRKGHDGRPEIRAVEAIPVTDTHMRPRRLTGEPGMNRVHVLNYLATKIDSPDGKAQGLRFTPQADGGGLYCVPGAKDDPGKIGALCRAFTEAPPIPAALLGPIATDCRM